MAMADAVTILAEGASGAADALERLSDALRSLRDSWDDEPGEDFATRWARRYARYVGEVRD